MVHDNSAGVAAPPASTESDLGRWTAFSTVWYSNAAIRVTIDIIDRELGLGPNDLELDDVSLTPAEVLPQSATQQVPLPRHALVGPFALLCAIGLAMQSRGRARSGDRR